MMQCDMNCASCMEECESRTVFLDEELKEDYRKGVCQTGKIPKAKRYEIISSGENGWEKQPGHFLDEVVEEEEIKEAIRLAAAVFTHFENGNVQGGAFSSFMDPLLHDEDYISSLRFYVARENGRYVGVGATRSSGTQIALLHVWYENQRQGIGRALFERMLRDDPLGEMQVHASPGSVDFFKKLDFEVMGEMTEEDCLRYVPMRFVRKRVN